MDEKRFGKRQNEETENLVVNPQTTSRHFLKIKLENWSEAQCLVDLAVKHGRRDLLEILLSRHSHLHWDQYHVDQALHRNDRETADFLKNRFPNSFDKNSSRKFDPEEKKEEINPYCLEHFCLRPGFIGFFR